MVGSNSIPSNRDTGIARLVRVSFWQTAPVEGEPASEATEVRTQVHDEGWSAEFAIPFHTLRYDHDAEQEWGIN